MNMNNMGGYGYGMRPPLPNNQYVNPYANHYHPNGPWWKKIHYEKKIKLFIELLIFLI